MGRADDSRTYVQVTAARSGDGRVHLFALDRNGEVWSMYQTLACDGWNTDGFGPLGRHPDSGMKHISAERDADGLIELFGVGLDGNLYNRWQIPGFAWNNQGFQHFPGIDSLNSTEVGRSDDGRIELLMTRSDGRVFQRWHSVGGGWNDQGFIEVATGTQQVEIARNLDGVMELFTINGGRVFNRYQLPPNALWHPTDNLRGVPLGVPMGGSSVTQIVAVGSD